jgi:hypothetical protein
MEISANPLDWTSNDEENLAKFLDTETGKRFIPKLIETAPSLLNRGHVNAILIRSGELRGYQEVVRSILVLAHPAPKPAAPESEYPLLEDDRHWEGEKLNPETPK